MDQKNFILTKFDKLRDELTNITPKGELFDDYISNFSEEMTYIFRVNIKNVDVNYLNSVLWRNGFFVVGKEKVCEEIIEYRVRET